MAPYNEWTKARKEQEAKDLILRAKAIVQTSNVDYTTAQYMAAEETSTTSALRDFVRNRGAYILNGQVAGDASTQVDACCDCAKRCLDSMVEKAVEEVRFELTKRITEAMENRDVNPTDDSDHDRGTHHSPDGPGGN